MVISWSGTLLVKRRWIGSGSDEWIVLKLNKLKTQKVKGLIGSGQVDTMILMYRITSIWSYTKLLLPIKPHPITITQLYNLHFEFKFLFLSHFFFLFNLLESSQSRADILTLSLAVTDILTGLIWLSIRPKYIPPVRHFKLVSCYLFVNLEQEKFQNCPWTFASRLFNC